MKILLLTQVAPNPPDSGPKIKTFNVLRYLALQHEVHLVSFVRSTAESDSAQELRRYCASVTTVPLRRSRLDDLAYLLRSLATGRPFLVERDDRAAMRAAIRAQLDRHAPDAVHADQLSMAQFALDLPLPLRVLDEHNAVWTIVRRAAVREGRGPRRLLAELEWRKLRAYEGQLCRSFDWVTVVSEEDRRALATAAGTSYHAAVVPIAIDTEQLAPSHRGAGAQHVLSVATMFYPPNVEGVHWFAADVFPKVREALADINFYIVGSRPPRRITQLADAASGVVVTGYIADLEPILQRCAVLVVPVHSGSGMRVKILEAFARGIPVVSTRIGVEGIDARPEEHLLVADDPQDFAQAVIRVVRDRGLAARLAAAGRDLVEMRYHWRTALRGLDQVYALGAAPRRA